MGSLRSYALVPYITLLFDFIIIFALLQQLYTRRRLKQHYPDSEVVREIALNSRKEFFRFSCVIILACKLGVSLFWIYSVCT